MTGKEFRIAREVVLPASPEQVFAAVTSGTAAWMFPTPPVSPDDPAVTGWEPPGLYSVRAEGPNGFNALEYLIEAREGGTAVLRYVHSGVFADDWDNQYDGASKHTDFYLDTLAQYLRHFDGRPAAWLPVPGPAASGAPEAFDTLTAALGLSASDGVGATVRLEIPGLDSVDTVVDYRNEYFLGLRGPDTLYRFFGRNHFGAVVSAEHHVFAADVDAEKTTSAWQSWLNGIYA